MKTHTAQTTESKPATKRTVAARRVFDAMADHEFKAAIRVIDSVEGERESWRVDCRYHRDGAGLICGERIRLSPSDDQTQAVIELDTLKNLLLLPDGRVRQATPDQIWNLSEKLMELI